MFVYKVLWIFTVKCLQLFNKELYVYFVQAPFCESFRKQSLTCSLYLKAEKSPGQTVKAHASFALPERSQTGVLLVPSKGKPPVPSYPVPQARTQEYVKNIFFTSSKWRSLQFELAHAHWRLFFLGKWCPTEGLQVVSLPLLALERLQEWRMVQIFKLFFYALLCCNTWKIEFVILCQWLLGNIFFKHPTLTSTLLIQMQSDLTPVEFLHWGKFLMWTHFHIFQENPN